MTVRLATLNGRFADRLQARLYYARKRRVARYEAQKAKEEAGDPGIFSADFSEDFE